MKRTPALLAILVALIATSPAAAQIPTERRASVHRTCVSAEAPYICTISLYRTWAAEKVKKKCLPKPKYMWVPAYAVPTNQRPLAATRARGEYIKALFAGGHRCIPDTPVAYGKWLAEKRYGWTGTASPATGEFGALYLLWNKESGWNPCRHYPSTTNCGYQGNNACGIPQFYPCSKLLNGCAATLGACHFKVQISKGLNYIKGRWETPSQAWAHSRCCNSY